MAVPLSLNTFGECAFIEFYFLFWCGVSLTLVSFTSFNNLMDVVAKPTWGPNKFFYYLAWILIHLLWGFTFFLVYWQPDPLFPAQPGRWNVYYLSLVFAIPHPWVVSLFHLLWWTYSFFMVAVFVFIFILLWDILVMLMFFLVGGNFLAGILHAASILILIYFTAFFWRTWKCTGDNGPRVTICTVVKKTESVTSDAAPLTTPGQGFSTTRTFENNFFYPTNDVPGNVAQPVTNMAMQSRIGAQQYESSHIWGTTSHLNDMARSGKLGDIPKRSHRSSKPN